MQLVAAACCVIDANPAIARITVVANQRLRFGALAALRGHAMSCNADFAVGGSGTVVVRPAAIETRTASELMDARHDER